MAKIEHDKAIILSRKPYGEADLIVTFFGENIGRQTGLARSSLVSSRRFGGGLEPGTIAEVQYRARRSKMLFLEEVAVELPAVSLLKSERRFSSAMKAIELAIAFLPEGEKSLEKFQLLKRFIEYLLNNEPRIADDTSFDLKWLKLTGYAPIISQCCYCGTTVSPKWTLIGAEGGVSCETCAISRGLRAEVPNDVRILANDVLYGKTVNWPENGLKELENSIDDYISYILGRSMNGRLVINSISM